MKADWKNMTFEKRRLIHSLVFPVLFLLICWLAKTYELVMDVSFVPFGIFPRTIEGLPGILFAPFIHGDMNHIYANTITFSVLGWAFFYFYREVALRVFLYILIFGDVLLWLGGRSAWHIGASGLIYGIAGFLFLSGVIRKNIGMAAISMIVVFLYGGMFWHIFPMEINDPVSWEGHLMGAMIGAVCAIYYRNIGPQKDEWVWEEEIDELEDEQEPEAETRGLEINQTESQKDKII